MKQSDSPTATATTAKRLPPTAYRIIAAMLILYGAIGVLVELRLGSLLLGALELLGQGITFGDRAADIGLLDPLWAHYAAQPALPWLAWLGGIVLLLAAGRFGQRSDAVIATDAVPTVGRLSPRTLLVLLVVGGALVLALGAFARLDLLLPMQRGLTEYPFDDEGVYAGASQLFLQGIMPYRDYFLAHPPLAAVVYAPAMAYHFTDWGSTTSFMLARYLSVGYSLLALIGFLLIGYLLGRGGLRGLLMGLTAATAWAVDGRAIEINQKVMLDQPMILASLFALLLYLLYARGREAAQAGSSSFIAAHPALLLGAAGFLAAASALTKIQGIACFLAIIADLGLSVLLLGRATRPLKHLFALGGGFFAGVVLLAGPFVLAAPDSFVRMVIFFQLLRPDDGLVLPADRIANLTMDLRNGVTIALAAVGVAVLGAWFWRKSGLGGMREGLLWLPVALWALFNVLLFTYSRSFYGHYYIQIAAPLCLLTAAIWQPLAAIWLGKRAALRLVVPVAALLLALPLGFAAWQGFTSRHEDRIFEIVSRYISDAVPSSADVLTTDEQFNLLAARAPSHNASGYLVDSYGHLIYMGLGLGQRSYDDLIAAVRRGEHSNDPDGIMHRAAPQTDLIDRANRAALLVVHYNQGARRLTPATMQQFEALGATCAPPQIERQSRYVIIRVCK